MITGVTITYINRTRHPGKPAVAVFLKNLAMSPGRLPGILPWQVMENLGYLSTCRFFFPLLSQVGLPNGDGNASNWQEVTPGYRWTVNQNQTGIVLARSGEATRKEAIEVVNQVKTTGGMRIQLGKNNKPLFQATVAFDQKATFILQPKPFLQPKLYWGLAESIRPGEPVEQAMWLANDFFELDIDGISRVTIALVGNPREGYNFIVEDSF